MTTSDTEHETKLHRHQAGDRFWIGPPQLRFAVIVDSICLDDGNRESYHCIVEQCRNFTSGLSMGVAVCDYLIGAEHWIPTDHPDFMVCADCLSIPHPGHRCDCSGSEHGTRPCSIIIG